MCVSKHCFVMNFLLAVLVIMISRSIQTKAFDVAPTGNLAPTQDSFKGTAKTSFELSGNSYQEGILDNTSNNLLNNHRRFNYIRNRFEKRSVSKKRRRYPFKAQDESKVITYRIVSYSIKLTHRNVKSALVKAFRKWAEVIPTVFRSRLGLQKADINILFSEGTHGCSQSFTGSNAASLEHSFHKTTQFPGEIHFNNLKNWTTSSDARLGQSNLVTVGMHLIGRVLELKQSVLSGTVMSDMGSTGRLIPTELQEDDITKIQNRYGQCETSFDAVEVWGVIGKTYFFKGNNYWRFDNAKRRTETDYPKTVSDWQGVPGDIDDMLSWGHFWGTYFFKGNRYCRYDDSNDRAGTFRLISQGWPGVPDNIDAAFTHNDWKTYFFKGNLVYQFDNIADKVSTGYPKLISAVFPGLPNNLDTAFRWYDMKSYFFKGKFFYIWSDSSRRANGPFLSKCHWKNHCPFKKQTNKNKTKTKTKKNSKYKFRD